MYQSLLARRYLLRKIIPLLAMLSVALCTAMVIVVLSVMGGFLEMVKEAGRKLIGDVAVQSSITGFPHYQEMLDEIRDLPNCEAATAIIQGYGLLKMPDNDVLGAQIIGIRGSEFDAVTNYRQTLFWRPQSDDEKALLDPNDWRHDENFRLAQSPDEKQRLIERMEQLGLTIGDQTGEPEAVLGIEVSHGNERIRYGSYSIYAPAMPGQRVTISVIPVTTEGAVMTEATTLSFTVVNEFSAGRYDVDSSQVFVPFEILQEMLHMEPGERLGEITAENGQPVLDEFGNPVRERIPTSGRASRIIIKATNGTSPDELKESVEAVVDRVHSRHADLRFISVLTWEEQIRQFIGAVKKETALVTTLFSIISLVSVFLVLSIFWTIVQQKTRDIGILRAVGASRIGVAWIFLRYGMIVGIIGSVLGSVLAHAVVWNINPLHEFVGKATGTYVWDPQVYYFNELPNNVNPMHALIIMIGGAAFAVAGALLPAIRAAYVDPVASLRYE